MGVKQFKAVVERNDFRWFIASGCGDGSDGLVPGCFLAAETLDELVFGFNEVARDLIRGNKAVDDGEPFEVKLEIPWESIARQQRDAR